MELQCRQHRTSSPSCLLHRADRRAVRTVTNEKHINDNAFGDLCLHCLCQITMYIHSQHNTSVAQRCLSIHISACCSCCVRAHHSYICVFSFKNDNWNTRRSNRGNAAETAWSKQEGWYNTAWSKTRLAQLQGSVSNGTRHRRTSKTSRAVQEQGRRTI